MRTFALAVASAAVFVAVPALAQDVPSAPAPVDATTDTAPASAPTAPDGSHAFGIDPYFGVMGGWEGFDNQPNRAGVPIILNANGTRNTTRKLNGGLVEGVAGFNVPLGPLFVGLEGNITKGFSGDVDWEYGGAGRFGVRAGDSGLIYGRVGYQWVRFDGIVPDNHDYRGMEYGIGFEVGPKQVGLGGLTQRSGIRLRGEVNTFGDFKSFRPMAGIIAHF